MLGVQAREKPRGKVQEQGLLFEYTVKLLLVGALLELVLFRLVSRLGMHFSRITDPDSWQYEIGRYFFLTLASIGPVLLNTVALLLFLGLAVLLFKKMYTEARTILSSTRLALVSLLTLLTIAYLIFPPGVLGSIVYNVIALAAILLLTGEYLVGQAAGRERGSSAEGFQTTFRWLFAVTFFLGISGWLYYQIVSTTYGMLGLFVPPEHVGQVHRIGEFLMVLASILVLPAYAATGFFSRNRRQRRRALLFLGVGVALFVALFFIDYFLGLYSQDVLNGVRKAGEGIGFIFQMGMGYTFYVPFALYVTGLLCWSYTVLKLVTTGRMAGYGLGLMFIAGYALQLSHQTLMVVLGLMLLNLDRRRVETVAAEPAREPALIGSVAPLVGEKT